MKNAVFWDVTPYGVPRLLVTANVVPCSPSLITFRIDAITFLQNVGSYKSHTAEHIRRRHSSCYEHGFLVIRML
jgi:hypothetical protein